MKKNKRILKPAEIKVNKKTRRSQNKLRNSFKSFKVYYVNIRGIKSKLVSINRILLDHKPQVVCITETHLEQNEKIKIEGYELYYNDNKKGKGGIIIGVREELKNITIETEKILDKYQTLWIKINNKKNKINIGTIYAPQESKNNLEVFKEMYNKIKDKINKIKLDNEKMLLTGNFDGKIL